MLTLHLLNLFFALLVCSAEARPTRGGSSKAGQGGFNTAAASSTLGGGGGEGAVGRMLADAAQRVREQVGGSPRSLDLVCMKW